MAPRARLNTERKCSRLSTLTWLRRACVLACSDCIRLAEELASELMLTITTVKEPVDDAKRANEHTWAGMRSPSGVSQTLCWKRLSASS